VYACCHHFDIKDILFDPHAISEIKLVHFLKFKEMISNEKSHLAKVYAREFSDVMYFLNHILDRERK